MNEKNPFRKVPVEGGDASETRGAGVPPAGILERTGEFWLREYYDHLIRNIDEFERAVRYVGENPVKAGLKDWPWV
jgi:hypothetical protein